MNVLILYSGNLGSTKKAAEYLADELGGARTEDTADAPAVDFGKFDCVVFGTNVRMFRLNKRFVKYAKLWVKSRTDKPVYAYVICADDLKSEKFVKKADKKLKKQGVSVYAGGELNVEGATKFEKGVIEGVTEAYKKEEKPLPELNYGVLRELSDKIKKQYSN